MKLGPGCSTAPGTRAIPGRRAGVILAIVLIAAWIFAVRNMPVDMSIGEFLPRGEDRAKADILQRITESPIASKLVLDIHDTAAEGANDGKGGDSGPIVAVAQRLMVELRSDPSTERVESGLTEESEEALSQFFSAAPSTAFLRAGAFERGSIEAALAETRSSLTGPLGPMLRRTAPLDPLGAIPGLLRSFQAIQGPNLSTQGGGLTTADGRHAFVILSPRGSSLDADHQRSWLRRIDLAFERARTSDTQVLSSSGVARYTVAAERQIRGDIERIGILSTAGILLLFLLVFRSSRMLLLGLVPIVVGSAVGTIATYLVFGRVHGLTLAFGTSLLGVGIDYVEHYFVHFALRADGSSLAGRERAAADTMTRVWPGLRLGAWTTIVGFAGLAWADFPGARQMALFASASVLGALVSTKWLVPPWMPRDYNPPAVLAHAERLAKRIVSVLSHLALTRATIPVALLVVLWVFGGLARLKGQDELRALLAVDSALLAEDSAIQRRLSAADPGRFAVVANTEDETALELLGRVHSQLTSAVAAGALGSFVPLGAVLSSARDQLRVRALAVEALPTLELLAAEKGFTAAAFRPFRASLSEPQVLNIDAVEKSPLGPWLAPLMPRVRGTRLFLIPLTGVKSTEALEAIVTDAAIIDESELLNGAYGHVRSRVLQLLAGGSLFVFASIYFRYRALRLTLSALLPPILGVFGTLACLGWLDIPITILHALGLALVVSMGEDYGIFAVEARASTEESACALVGVVIATLTTLLSFGLLAASDSPALAALGLTISLGMVFSMLLAPLAMAFASQPTAVEGGRG